MTADSYIIFELDQSAYAIRSDRILHVEMLEHVTPVPNAAPAVEGVVFSRGQVIPAINLRVRFGVPRQDHTPRTRLLYLKVDERIVALIVDSARQFERIPAESIRPIQETLVGVNGNYVEGVASLNGRSILVLDVGAVLTLEEIAAAAGAETNTPAKSP
jgi:purine-binding chemotaxis protein CheW